MNGKYISDHYWIETRINPFSPIKKPYIVRTHDNEIIKNFETLKEATEFVQGEEKKWKTNTQDSKEL